MSGYPVGMNFGSWGDDFYTQQMYQQIANGGYTYGGATGNAGGAAAGGATDANGKGFSFGKTLGWAGGAAAATGAGMYFTNNQFSSPITEEGGKKVFSKDFMKHFSGEYEALQNGDALEKYFKKLGTTKHPITAENYSKVMDELFEYMNDGDPKKFELSDELKAFVKKQGIDVKNPDVAHLRQIYGDNIYELEGLRSKNGYNHMTSRLSHLEEIAEEFKDLKKADHATRVEFLRENAHTLGIDKTNYAKLLDPATTEAEVKAIANGVNIKSRKTALKGEVDKIAKEMQKLVSKWDTNAGFWGKGGFKNVGNKKTAQALENAFSSMKKCKAGKYAGIAAVAGAVISLIA